MSKTGSYSIQDLLAARFTSAKEFGLDNIQAVLADELAAHNAMVDQAIAEIAMPTTDAQSIYGSAVGGDMSEVDEYGRAATQKAQPGSTVGFPLKAFQFNLGWTDRFMMKATPADLAIKMQNAQIAHRRQIMRQLKMAIYQSTNYTFYDHLVDNIAITVRAFLNADGEPIPAGPNGEIYDGSTETHYTAEASLTNANLVASVRNVIEKGHGGGVKMAINLADEAAVRALSGFNAYVDSRLTVNHNTNEPVARLDVSRVDNRPIGILDGAEVWVKPWALPSYAFTWASEGMEKPLKYRQENNAGLRGLRIAAENPDYPLYAQITEAVFGFGVWTRTNGAVHYFSGGSYVNPTL